MAFCTSLTSYSPLHISDIAVLITAQALHVDLKLHTMDLPSSNRTWKLDFLRQVRQRALLIFEEPDGFELWDTHAVVTYLVSKYAQEDSLYPKDVRKRTIVNHRLFFEKDFVSPRLYKIVDTILGSQRESLKLDEVALINEVYSRLEFFLEGGKWIAGDCVTVADYCWVASITFLNIMHGLDFDYYPNAAEWFDHCRHLPEYLAIEPHIDSYTICISDRLFGLFPDEDE